MPNKSKRLLTCPTKWHLLELTGNGRCRHNAHRNFDRLARRGRTSSNLASMLRRLPITSNRPIHLVAHRSGNILRRRNEDLQQSHGAATIRRGDPFVARTATTNRPLEIRDPRTGYHFQGNNFVGYCNLECHHEHVDHCRVRPTNSFRKQIKTAINISQ